MFPTRPQLLLHTLANTWHACGTVHCTSNPLVSAVTPSRVCPICSGPGFRVVLRSAAVVLAAPIVALRLLLAEASPFLR